MTMRAIELPKITLLLVFPAKKQAIKMIAPMTTNIRPKFFNKLFMCVYFYSYFFSSDKLKHNSLKPKIISGKSCFLL